MQLFDIHRKHWRRDLRSQYDVVVIGAGIGGMSAAIALAQDGYDVLLLEQHIVPGGCCSAFVRSGFTFDAAVHNLAGGGRYASYGQMLRRLGVNIELIEIEPNDTIVMPDLEFTFPRLLPDIQAELQRHFQHEATGIESFFRTFQKLYRSVWRADERDQLMFSRLSAISFEQLLRDHISDQRCRQIIAGQWPYLAVPPSRLAALEGVLTLGSYLLQGTYYPKGGTQALANAYLQRFETLGGTVSLNTPVRTIHSEGNRICGVWLDHERLISTKAVVANIAPHTLLNLLNTDLARDICRCNISNLQTTSSAFLCYFGFNSKADLSPIPWGFYFGPDYESLDRWLFVSKPSHHDSSLAPNGGQIICTMLGYNGPFHPKHNFAQMKTDAFDFILDIFTKRSPEIHRYLEVKTTASPATIHRYTGNYNGTVYGWASTVQQSGKQRLSYEFALPGLFLVGHWTQPGSGVPAVTLSGLNLAPRISQFLCP